MMLAHPQMDAVLDFSAEHVNTLVIENPAFFREFLRDMTAQIDGFSGKAVLSDRNMPIEFSKNAEIIDNLLSFEISRKPLITKLIARMESLSVQEENYVRMSSLIGGLEQYIMELSFQLPCDIFCSKMSLGSILRSVGVEIQDDYENDLERLLDYMELTRELDRSKLFVFVNLRSYYSDEDVSAFLESVLAHEYLVLLIDSVSRKKLPKEFRTTVDSDLCEF